MTRRFHSGTGTGFEGISYSIITGNTPAFSTFLQRIYTRREQSIRGPLPAGEEAGAS